MVDYTTLLVRTFVTSLIYRQVYGELDLFREGDLSISRYSDNNNFKTSNFHCSNRHYQPMTALCLQNAKMCHFDGGSDDLG